MWTLEQKIAIVKANLGWRPWMAVHLANSFYADRPWPMVRWYRRAQ